MNMNMSKVNIKTKMKTKNAKLNRYPVFNAWMVQQGFTPEFKFLKDRRFKFDWAHTELLIAVECHGGAWISGGGRHNRATGFLSDMERENLAVLAGWALLKISPEMIQKGTAHQLVEKALVELDPTKTFGEP